MAHQVFVSHATEDAEAASRLCALLEAEGVDCWLALRDISEDSDRAAAILEAIRTADLVLLLFSARANTSPTVLRDIERAIGYERPVLSIHLDAAVPNPSLEYYLNMWQWLDASAGVEAKRDDIVAAVREQLAAEADAQAGASAWRWLDAPSGVDSKRSRSSPRWGTAGSDLRAGAGPTPATAGAVRWRRLRRRTWAILGGATAALLVLALGLGLGLGLHGATSQDGRWTRLEPTEMTAAVSGVDYEAAMARLCLVKGGDLRQSAAAYWTARDYDPVTNTWIEFQPVGPTPPPLLGYSAADDPVTRRGIIFGGTDVPGVIVPGGGFTFRTVAVMWAWDYASATWTELEPSGPVPPSRLGAGMAFDPTTRRLIMFGGWKDIDFPKTTGQVGTFLNDTWAYDPVANTWTELKPSGTLPSPRQPDGMLYDPATGRILVFGGAGGETGAQNDIWAYEPTGNRWIELNPRGPRPEKRWGAGIAYDAMRRQVILFGGSPADQSKYYADTWLYDVAGNAWTELKPSGTLPSPRAGALLKYFEATDQVIMFAGLGPSGDLKDLWAFER